MLRITSCTIFLVIFLVKSFSINPKHKLDGTGKVVKTPIHSPTYINYRLVEQIMGEYESLIYELAESIKVRKKGNQGYSDRAIVAMSLGN